MIICKLFAIVGSTLGHLTALLVDCILDGLLSFNLYTFFYVEEFIKSIQFSEPDVDSFLSGYLFMHQVENNVYRSFLFIAHFI